MRKNNSIINGLRKIPSYKVSKEVKDLYNRNYKTLKNEIKEDIRR
jgi:hypothetical protein